MHGGHQQLDKGEIPFVHICLAHSSMHTWKYQVETLILPSERGKHLRRNKHYEVAKRGQLPAKGGTSCWQHYDLTEKAHGTS